MSAGDNDRQMRESINHIADRAAEGVTNAHEMAHNLATAQALGAMGANIITLLDRQERMERKLDGVVALTNRWKGASAALILLAGFVGGMSAFLLKLVGKA
jgi:hypothetical protein